MSTENSTRNGAEAWFSQQLGENCMGMVQTLLSIFADSSSTTVIRSFAGLLLRRAVENSDFSEEDTAVLRGYLIQLWNQESNAALLKRLAHVISQSAQNRKVPWPGMLPQIVANVSIMLSILSCFMCLVVFVPFFFFLVFMYYVLCISST